jgi:hypothetical protein
MTDAADVKAIEGVIQSYLISMDFMRATPTRLRAYSIQPAR